MAIKTYRMAGRIVSLFLLIVLFSATAQARVIYVDDDGSADFNNIQAAIDDAVHGDVIEVQPGTYTGAGNHDIDFEGKHITLRSLEGPHNCIIDCHFLGRAFYFQRTPLFPPGPGQNVKGFTIKGGHAQDGGAISCHEMRPVFIDCIFQGNNASRFGGALYSEGRMPVLVRCIFIGNSARYGGAIYSSGGDVDFMLVTNCVFKSNMGFSKGGAILAEDGMSLTNCTIVNNSALGGDVGGILSERLVKAKNCILWDNRDSTRNGNTTEQAQITGSPVYTYHCCIEDWSGSFSGYGNIGSDPCLFPDNYHLKPNSSCIGVGRNAFVDVDTDIDGQPRIIAGQVDIGADEFTIQTPSIEISSNSFTFQMDEGVPGPPPQSFDIWNGFLGTLNWSIESDCPWLMVSPLSGQSVGERNEVTLAIDANTLHSGRHDCELIVSDANALKNPQRIRIILNIKGPMIGISPETLLFSYYAGLPHPEPKVLSVWNDYIGTLNWSVSEDCNWLSVSPVSGRSDGEIDELTVVVDANVLPVGTYHSVLEVSDSNALNSPFEVPVTLEVRRPVIAVNPEEISFVHAYGEPNPFPQMISIRNADLGILNWQIIEDCNWISVNPATGRSQGDANMVNITVYAWDLSPGSYSCSLAVSDPDASNSPYVVPVSLVIARRTVHVPEHFSTIQDAIDNVLDEGTVIIAQGTYNGPGNRDIDFRGKAITVRSIDPNDPNIVASTIIDCNGTKAERHRGFYFQSKEKSNSILNGLTIMKGWEYPGAAILCGDAEPTIKNCIVMDNVAYYPGGSGMIHCNNGSDSTITGCTVFANDGYGIYCNDSDAVIKDCIIVGNKEVGISCVSSYLEITNCIIRNNSLGIELSSCTGFVKDCEVIGNSNSGIALNGSFSTIRNCRIIGNVGGDGGGIRCRYYHPTIINCIIAGNLAIEEGGGIYCYDESRPKIVNCVIVNNEALGYGGGIYSYDEAEPFITNSILWGNKATVGPEIALYSNSGRDTFGKMTISYSNVEGGQEIVFVDVNCVLDWGMGMMDVEPGFAFEGDYHLTSDSPCIDTGTNNPFGGLLALDFDGNFRPLDGDENGQPFADIGVYEFNAQQPTIALSVDSLEFFTQEDGPEPNGQNLFIRNAGGNTLIWEIMEDCDWLEVIPHTGVSDGEINDVMINVVSTGLTHGIYNCKLRIKDEQAVNNPRDVIIALHVNKTLYVPSEYETIQGAIDNSIDADVVLVADNTYVGEGNKDLDFKGKNIIVRSENGPENCIIDCEGQGRGFYLHSWETSPAAIEGFTIINGCPDTVGGGIRCTGYSYNSPVTIKNCVIMNCTSTASGSYGNGIFCGYGTSIESCTVQGNKGGIAAFYGATISNCVVNDNYDVPGIVCAGGRPTIEHCTINGNQGGGMTLLHHNEAIIDNCVIMGNVVRQEHSYYASGAGINCFTGSSPTISNTIISGNFTEIGGGGICCNMESNAKIINCTITGNRANHCGGGIWSSDYCYLLVTNSILWSNIADFGSQIAIGRPTYPESGYGGILVNYCDVEGGAIDIFAGSNYTIDWGSGNVDADPCFVQPGYWEVILPPLPAKASEPYPFNGQVSVSIYTDLYWIAGSGATSHDIYFGTSNPPPFVVNQSSTIFSPVTMDYNTTYYWRIDELNVAGKTIGDVWSFTTREEITPPPPPPPPPPFSAYTDDVPQYIWIEGDYHLQFDSLCIDTGDPNYISEPNGTDLDGKPRVINGRIDMGAYEYNPPVTAEVDIDPNTLNLNSKGRWITAFIWLPEEYNVADIDPNSILLEGKVKPERFWLTEDEQIAEAKFDREQVQAILAVGDIELTITGQLTDGTSFEAADLIKVIDKGGKK